MKKGFTLVELLAVIVILGVLSGIGVVVVTNTVNASRKKSLDFNYESIEKAALAFGSKHIFDEFEASSTCKSVSSNCCTKLPGESAEKCYIVLDDLIIGGFIESVNNPVTGGLISGSTLIEIGFESNKLVYKVIR